MLKKYSFLVLLLFFLTGCTATVNVTIDKDSVEENIIVKGSNITEYNEIRNWSGFPLEKNYDDYMENYLSVDNNRKSGVSYYDVTNNNETLTTNVSASFNYFEYENSSIVRNCFEYFNILEEGDMVIFSTSKGLRCNFNNFNIVVNTPYLVTTNNASNVNTSTNTFTWTVGESAPSNFGIFMEIDLSKKYNESASNTNNELTESNSTYLVLIIVGILFAIGVIALVLFLLKKKNESSSL